MKAIQRVLLIAGLTALTLIFLTGLLAQDEAASAMPPTPAAGEYITGEACITCHADDGSITLDNGTVMPLDSINADTGDFTATRIMDDS